MANTLGVGETTVGRAYKSLKSDGKLSHLGLFSKSDRRGQVQDYFNENPDASNREVADSVEADVSHATVGNWRKEWEDDEEDEKFARAIKMNLLGRDTDQGVKADAVEKYITRAWTTDDETGALVRLEENGSVANKLGVSNQTVGRVINDFQAEIIYHDRLKAREYYRDNPDASYREVARQVDASQPTVTEWLKRDFDEGDDEDDDDDTEQQPLNMLARNQSEVEQTREKSLDHVGRRVAITVWYHPVVTLICIRPHLTACRSRHPTSGLR